MLEAESSVRPDRALCNTAMKYRCEWRMHRSTGVCEGTLHIIPFREVAIDEH